MSKVTDIIADVARIDSVESTANASAPQATTYTKAETDAITDLLAPQATTYTKVESDAITNLLATKANPSITGSITEEVSVATTVLEPDNGTVQTKTLTANTTFTDGLADGQFLTLIVTNAGFTITYPTITWWGGAEPTLGTTDKLFFEKIGSTLYGSHIGSI